MMLAFPIAITALSALAATVIVWIAWPLSDSLLAKRGLNAGGGKAARMRPVALWAMTVAIAIVCLNIESWNRGSAAFLAWLAVGLTCAIVIAVCDMRARIIPWEPCACLAVAGCAFQVANWPPEDPIGTALKIAVAAAAFASTRMKASFANGKFGRGDAYALAATAAYLACRPPHAVDPAATGLMVAGLLLIATAGIALAIGKLRLKDTVALGPFFSTWQMAGALSVAAAFA